LLPRCSTIINIYQRKTKKMDYITFNSIVGQRFDQCGKVLTEKGEEYSRAGDRLWNFKRAGAKTGKTPVEALMGMKAKHDVSIDDMVDMLKRGVVPARGIVAEKIGDSINYLLLLEGLIEETREAAEGSVQP
jgi:hypothetical protein